MRFLGCAPLVVAPLLAGCPPAGPVNPGGPTGTELQIVVDGAAFPTAIDIAPDGRLFYTEKATGQVRVVTAAGELLSQPFATVPVVATSERGLLGIALHPEFASNGFVYVFYTRSSGGAVEDNRVARFRAEGNVATGPEEFIFTMPAEPGPIHNGGQLAFGPDGKLYITIGDLAVSDNAQNPNVRAGKVLRINDDGSIPADNPFGPGNATFVLGIRNSFGIAFDPVSGLPFATDNGTIANDEVNRLVAGGNYGWPIVRGSSDDPRFISPIIDYGEGSFVPTGLGFFPDATFGAEFEHQLLVAQYRTGRILRYPLDEAREAVESENVFIQGITGGITDLEFAPDGTFYISTSNQILHVVPTGP